jgi:glycerophosphoryl diester phosphodiesterase
MSVSDWHSPAWKLLANHRPLVIGHRGYCQFAPENTLPSFELALKAGVDLVELDCRQTSDGVFVVIHDPELNRTTDARRQWKRRHNRVDSRTALEIKTLDGGRWFNAKFAGTGVPLLTEALDLIQKHSLTLIEHKAGEAGDLVRLLRERHLINRVIVQSFDWHFLRIFHQFAPEQVLGALGPAKVLVNGRKPTRIFRRLSTSWIRELQKTGARLAVWSQQVSPRSIALAHRHHLKVWVYTVNTQRRANRLLNFGVDGLITDNPALIWRTLALRSPK